jgi:nucleoid-associated protein YgaU
MPFGSLYCKAANKDGVKKPKKKNIVKRGDTLTEIRVAADGVNYLSLVFQV